MSVLYALSRRFAQVVWPRACPACGVAVGDDDDWCFDCAVSLSTLVGEPYCFQCGSDAHPHLLIDGRCGRCRAGRGRFGDFIRVGRYDGALKTLVLRYKREFTLDAALGRLLGDAIRGRIDPAAVDGWVPIPSHWFRRMRRGFEPTRLLAQAAVQSWRGRVQPILRLTRYVPPLHHSMPVTRRVQAVRGAFALTARADVHGKTIAIVDDVSTTGATLMEAARVLRRAGARRIIAAVVAKTSSNPHTPRIMEFHGAPATAGSERG